MEHGHFRTAVGEIALLTQGDKDTYLGWVNEQIAAGVANIEAAEGIELVGEAVVDGSPTPLQHVELGSGEALLDYAGIASLGDVKWAPTHFSVGITYTVRTEDPAPRPGEEADPLEPVEESTVPPVEESTVPPVEDTPEQPDYSQIHATPPPPVRSE